MLVRIMQRKGWSWSYCDIRVLACVRTSSTMTEHSSVWPPPPWPWLTLVTWAWRWYLNRTVLPERVTTVRAWPGTSAARTQSALACAPAATSGECVRDVRTTSPLSRPFELPTQQARTCRTKTCTIRDTIHAHVRTIYVVQPFVQSVSKWRLQVNRRRNILYRHVTQSDTHIETLTTIYMYKYWALQSRTYFIDR